MRSTLATSAVLVMLAGCEASQYREADVALSPPSSRSAPAPAPEAAAGPRAALRFSVAAVESPRDTYAAYSRLIGGIGARLGVPVEFVQRRTYREVNELLAAGKLDVALVCTGGYLDLRKRSPGAVEILAVPIVEGKATYESLVLVPAASPARTIADLAGKRFAYTDELSLSGNAYARRLVRDLGHDPDRFYGSVTFTRSHDRSISAVGSGLVDGAAVHGGVWAHLVRNDPDLPRRVRVLHRSPPFGAMPVVASLALPAELRARIREELLGLAEHADGQDALRHLGIDRFDAPTPGLYDGAARLVEGLR